MKRFIAVLFSAILVLPIWVRAEHESHEMKGSAATLKGHVVELNCYIKHGAKGKSHAKCAQECAEKGMPLGLLTEDGKIYQISGPGHDDLVKANKGVMKYVEEDVTIEGETFSRNGVNLLVVHKIK